MFRRLLAVLLVFALGACGGDRRVARAPSPAGQSVEASEAVWHLRVGLNVAALLCKGRGRVSVAGDYGRVLGRHRALFADAYAAEQRRHGSGFERHQTRLYNRFSNQRDPAGFCRRAASTARQALVLDSFALSRKAAALVGQID